MVIPELDSLYFSAGPFFTEARLSGTFLITRLGEFGNTQAHSEGKPEHTLNPGVKLLAIGAHVALENYFG